jgi:hypothetical protein
MTAPITVEPGRLLFTMPVLGAQDYLVVEHAMHAYAWVLPQGEHTWQDFAAAIAECCSLENPQNNAVHDAVLRCHGALACVETVVEEPPRPPRRNPRDKPNKRFPWVFVGLWRNGGPQCITRCKTEKEARDAGANFFAQHTTGSVRGAKVKLLDGSVQVFDANGDYFFTVPPLA